MAITRVTEYFYLITTHEKLKVSIKEMKEREGERGREREREVEVEVEVCSRERIIQREWNDFAASKRRRAMC